MKKLFLYITLSTLIFTTFSQVEEHNGKKYILPDAISSNGCVEFNYPDSIYDSYPIQLRFLEEEGFDNKIFINDYAQLFHTEDSLKIIGIAGYMIIGQDML